jgi:hypothetical protein
MASYVLPTFIGATGAFPGRGLDEAFVLSTSREFLQ